MSLEAHFFTKLLKNYKANYNRLDKNLASMLYETVDMISEFLADAQIQEDDDKSDIREIIPSINSDVLQSHRYYYCKACNGSVRASAKSFSEHLFGNKHLKKLREHEQTAGAKDKPKAKRNFELQQLKGSTQSLDSLKSEKTNDKKSKKERLNSLPAVVGKQPEPGIPLRIREFLAKADIEGSTVSWISEGIQIMKRQTHVRVCEMIQQRLQNRFPDVKAYPFGSMVIGLGKKGGDLDIFIDIGNCYAEKPGKRKMKDAIHFTSRILQMGGNQWGDFDPVTKARTPILRVYCRAEKIDCDLSFSNGLSHCNTILIHYFIELQPVCRKLCAFIKALVAELQFGLNSYLVSLLVIYFLQQQALLPPVAFLQQNIEPFVIDGWQSNFMPLNLAQLKMPIATDFYKYLLGFLKFYGWEFNYEQHVVSILTGCPEEKKIFDHGNEENLPPVFARYKNYMSKIDLDEADEVEDLFSNHKPLVVQDPFELCHNVAKGVQLPKLQKIVSLLRRTHEIISQRKKF